MAIKVAIGGPPHSGKTVIMGLLRALLSRDKFVVVEAAPDGEGITGWSFEADPELVRAVRRKGKFLPQFVEWVARSVRASTAPITLVDLGGMLLDESGKFVPVGISLTPQNERIMRECTHLIVIASPKYAEAVPVWILEAERLGVKPLAILESILEGADDEIFSKGDPLRARITKLERENPPLDSATAKAVAGRLIELTGEAKVADGSEAADVNFVQLAEELDLPLKNGGPDRDWEPSVLPHLIEVVSERVSGKTEIKLWGNLPAGFPYHGLACALPGIVRYYDPKLGYVPAYDLAISAEPGQFLSWRTQERDFYSLVEFTIPGQIFDVFYLPLVSVPPVTFSEGMIVSGKAPWWLTGAICRAYFRAGCAWVAILAPRESGRLVEGVKWSDANLGKAPAIVIASRDPKVPLGSVIAFDL